MSLEYTISRTEIQNNLLYLKTTAGVQRMKSILIITNSSGGLYIFRRDLGETKLLHLLPLEQ